MNRCKDCKHFFVIKTDAGRYGAAAIRHGFGDCDRWKYGYNLDLDNGVAANEVIVENDEHWGALVGPEFGCVLWEKK